MNLNMFNSKILIIWFYWVRLLAGLQVELMFNFPSPQSHKYELHSGTQQQGLTGPQGFDCVQ